MNVIEMFNKSFDWFVRALTGLAVALLVPMMFLVTGDVVGRYLLKKPIPAVFEINSCFLMVIVVFFPLAYVHQRGEHVFVTLFTGRLPKKVQTLFDLFSVLLGIASFGLIGWYGLEKAISSTRVWEYIPGIIDVPVWISKWFIPLGAFTFCIELMRDACRRLRLITKPES
jgi:TRAP-type C4-dicarboxylate transport system permease small subunit